MKITLGASRIEPTLHKELRLIMGTGNFSVLDVDRMAYSRDMWPRSLLWLREGKVKYLPDCIVWPENSDQIQKNLHSGVRSVCLEFTIEAETNFFYE